MFEQLQYIDCSYMIGTKYIRMRPKRKMENKKEKKNGKENKKMKERSPTLAHDQSEFRSA